MDTSVQEHEKPLFYLLFFLLLFLALFPHQPENSCLKSLRFLAQMSNANPRLMGRSVPGTSFNFDHTQTQNWETNLEPDALTCQHLANIEFPGLRLNKFGKQTAKIGETS